MHVDSKCKFTISTGFDSIWKIHHISDSNGECHPFVCCDDDQSKSLEDSQIESDRKNLKMIKSLGKKWNNFVLRREKSSPYFQFCLQPEGLNIGFKDWKLVCKDEVPLAGYTNVIWANLEAQMKIMTNLKRTTMVLTD